MRLFEILSNSNQEIRMNRLIGVIVLLVAVLVGLGFYRGWFSVMWDDEA